VRTTRGEEQAVAAAIRERAAAEHAAVASVMAPRRLEGAVLVEGLDFDRLANLVAAVQHTRGVARTAGGGEPGDSQVAWERVEQLMAQEDDGEPIAVEDLLGARQDEPAAVRRPRGDRPPRKAKAGAIGGEAETAPPGPAAPAGPWARRALNLAILVPPLALVAGYLVAPAAVWDGFLYPYFWSSIEADARNVGGAAESYNVLNTLAYALILVPALLFIWRVLDRVKVRVDDRFLLMLTPFIVLGGAARALEDALYFKEPAVFAFISPLIYVAEGFLVLALVVSAAWVATTAAAKGPQRGVAAWVVAFAPGAAALVVLGSFSPHLVAAPIPAPILLSAVSAAFLAGAAGAMRPGAGQPHRFVVIAGFLLLAVAAYLIVRWATLGGWEPTAEPVPTHLGEAPAVLLLAASAAALTWAGLWLLAPRAAWAKSMLAPVNLLVLFGQYLDGAATYWGIDHFGYQEKHVLTGFFIEQAGTAVVMFPIKLVFVLFVLYLIDVMFRDDLKDPDGKPGTLAGLLKLTVLAVGMGPGTRDLLRLVMGV
jgi:uncharacterized membrane protein